MKACTTASLLDGVQRLKADLANLLYWSQSMSAGGIKTYQENNPGRDGLMERSAVRRR